MATALEHDREKRQPVFGQGYAQKAIAGHRGQCRAYAFLPLSSLEGAIDAPA
jgi:hypothetical protein